VIRHIEEDVYVIAEVEQDHMTGKCKWSLHIGTPEKSVQLAGISPTAMRALSNLRNLTLVTADVMLDVLADIKQTIDILSEETGDNSELLN